MNPQFGYTTANPGVNDPYVMNTNTDGYGQLRGNHVLTTTVSYDLGFASLKYIGGFQQYNYQTGGDYDGTSRTAGIPGILAGQLYFPTQTTDFNEHKRYYSNEVNLTSNGDGPLRWILGVYQYEEEYRQRIQLGNPNQASLANPLMLAGTPAAVSFALSFFDASTVRVPINTVAAPVRPELNTGFTSPTTCTVSDTVASFRSNSMSVVTPRFSVILVFSSVPKPCSSAVIL